MEDRFEVNKRKENLIYLGGFIFSGVINIAFWISLPGIIRDSVPGDGPFIFLGGFAAAGSFIALVVHYLMFRNATKNDQIFLVFKNLLKNKVNVNPKNDLNIKTFIIITINDPL